MCVYMCIYTYMCVKMCIYCDVVCHRECEGNVPGHSKCAQTCLTCRAETDMAASSIFHEERSRTSVR